MYGNTHGGNDTLIGGCEYEPLFFGDHLGDAMVRRTTPAAATTR